MKKLLILIIGAMILWGCGSGTDSKEITDYKSEITKVHQDFMTNEKAGFDEFQEMIKKFKTKSSLDYSKTAFADKTNEIELNMREGGVVFQMVNNRWESNTSLGKYNPYFGDQKIIENIAEMLEQHIDSFWISFNDKARYNELTRLINEFKAYSKLKYILIMQVIENKAPVWRGSTYDAGVFKGKLLMYDVSSEELLSVMDINAMSSSNVSSSSFNNLGDAAKSDYYKNINTAIKESVNKNYKITGYLSSFAVPK